MSRYTIEEKRIRHCEMQREYRQRNLERVREIEKRSQIKRSKDDPAFYRKKSEYIRRTRPTQHSAWAAVYRALQKGTLVRPSKCQSCSKECKPEAHHNDYSKWLEIEWLCRTCHLKTHGNRWANKIRKVE